MSNDHVQEEAVAELQQFGLKEYEAECFVGLTRLETGTAKTLSQITDVPRTRVYDAVRVLESKGLVEIHHSSPRRFRAVPLDEAMATLRDQYETRLEQVEASLDSLDAADAAAQGPDQEVWSITGTTAIDNRLADLLEAATDEVVLVIGDPSVLSADLHASLRAVAGDVDLLVGTLGESLRDRIQAEVPEARTFTSGLEWLQGEATEARIGRLLLVDRSALLVSTIDPETGAERAVFSSGIGNGFVIIARRLMTHGLLPHREAGASQGL